MARIFIYDNKELPDSDPNMTPDEVRQSLTQFFPELSNAEIITSKRGEDQVFTFKKRVGTKGATEMPGCRIRIKRGQPWEEEYGTLIAMEGALYKIKLDNGESVLQTRGHFIILSPEGSQRKYTGHEVRNPFNHDGIQAPL